MVGLHYLNLPEINLSVKHLNIKKNALKALMVTGLMTVVYLLLNHRKLDITYPNFLFGFEQQLPFCEFMVLYYWLALLIAITIPVMINNQTVFKQAMVANLISFCLNASIWFLFPVTYPRNEYTIYTDTYTSFLYQNLVSIDSTLNSFPSGHATLLFIVAWLSVNLSKRRFKYPILSVCILGLLSIVLIKQHSIIDGLAGFLTAFIGIVMSQKVMVKKIKN